MNAIEIKKLTKKYRDVTAVDGLELSVRRGELFAPVSYTHLTLPTTERV